MDGRFDVVFGFDMETDVGSFTDYYNGVQKVLRVCRNFEQ